MDNAKLAKLQAQVRIGACCRSAMDGGRRSGWVTGWWSVVCLVMSVVGAKCVDTGPGRDLLSPTAPRLPLLTPT